MNPSNHSGNHAAHDYPAMCAAVGLDCESCTAASARELASACPGLRPKMVGQLFVQIYTEPACSRMHAHFARAYAQALEEPEPFAMERKGPAKVRMVAAAAFA
jgi:hypothetical protein